jgi:hypothetical protein
LYNKKPLSSSFLFKCKVWMFHFPSN